jgi:hypothetical protein
MIPIDSSKPAVNTNRIFYAILHVGVNAANFGTHRKFMICELDSFPVLSYRGIEFKESHPRASMTFELSEEEILEHVIPCIL